LVVPLLFSLLPTPAMAGGVAAKLFAAQTWVSVACALLLLLLSRPKGSVRQYHWAQAAMVFILGGMLLALLVQYGVAPRIVARQDLRLWHSVGSVMYGLQWICALVVLLKMWPQSPEPSECKGTDSPVAEDQGH
jgi:peptidoglycan biosynthesis protein MviN/MurJ (putative lipid II flippase)